METKTIETDVVVVGLGTSGASVAYLMAKAGRSVAMVDRLPEGDTSSGWINGIPAEAYDWLGLDRPSPPERLTRNFPILLTTEGYDGSLVVPLGGMWNIDMKRLILHLQVLAREHGAQHFFRTEAIRLDYENKRPVALSAIQTSEKGKETSYTFRAKLFIDTTGMRGVLRTQDPTLRECCPPVANTDVCTAMQQECDIVDESGVKEFLRRLDIKPGAMVNKVAIAGGWSTEAIHVSKDLKTVGVLCGCINDGLRPTGPQLVKDAKRRMPWIGQAHHQGAGLIPLRHTYDRFVTEGLALLGESACMVFPLHGSGVMRSFVAARMLVDAVGDKADPGDLNNLWQYQARVQREFGGIHAFYDALRRLSQSLNRSQVLSMFEGGLMSPGLITPGFYQRIDPPEIKDVLDVMKGIVTRPRFLAKALPSLMKMPMLLELYKYYPKKPDLKALKRWSRLVAAIFGVKPDIT